MKTILLQIETKIQELIEEKSLSLFGLSKSNNRIFEEILHSIKPKLKISEDGKVLSPNLFAIHFPVRFSDEIKSNLEFSNQITEIIYSACNNLGIHFEHLVEINIYSDDQITEGEFKVFSSYFSNRQTETQKMTSATSEATDSIESEAYLIVNGVDIFSIEQAVLNIGRNKDNQLVIKDPRVSRKHAQIRNIDGIYVLSDLGSTSGTTINDQKIQQVTLHPGDVISLAGVLLVFGNEAVNSLEDTKEFLVRNKTPEKENPRE
ncbi:MAG: FHA domain-containing protein [Chloroflexi bacterium]|mgnify:CR=1|jgi:hypothetical protein|nr:FHA domain-containing protein [Chloroflexota bacterium]MBT4004106.1 FHA domain-containing protein [Chloroflexota bacterium]MBT4305779.1 FHA domain-containing protein [Chloroflexota bacterium]MBT4533603.1 FHA domain-containing protein [Chloroflexota bacterium]MBT4681754.1 FHA domain-containing protein [Chloroflexota bacterium]